MGYEQQVDQWREFYPAVASAAAVLLGLVFVALSLHLEKAQAPGIPVLGLGSQALINLIYVLLVSLGMLAPYRFAGPARDRGLGRCRGRALRLGGTLRRAQRAREPHLTVTSLAVPVVLPIVCFVLLVVGGVAVIARQPYGPYLLAGQRRADRQRNPEHLDPAAVRSHALTEVITVLCQQASRRLPRRPYGNLPTMISRAPVALIQYCSFSSSICSRASKRGTGRRLGMALARRTMENLGRQGA
jgi:hypothetical protein